MKRIFTVSTFALIFIASIFLIAGCASEQEGQQMSGDLLKTTIDAFGIVVEDFPDKVAAATPETKAEVQQDGQDIMDNLNEFETYLNGDPEEIPEDTREELKQKIADYKATVQSSLETLATK